MLNGHQIAQARKEKGLTQIQLADLMHVSTEAVSKWEKGAYAPGSEKEDKLRRILGTTTQPGFSNIRSKACC